MLSGFKGCGRLVPAIAALLGISFAAAAQGPNDSAVVLSRETLDPPLRSGNRYVRFSPNGEYILAQDDSGVRVFTREPLDQILYTAATRVLPAVFSADSHRVLILAAGLDLDIVNLANGKAEQKSLASGIRGCIESRLSPAGNAAACLDDEWKLHVLNVPEGREVFRSTISTVPGRLLLWEPLSTGSAFSEPFGYIATNAWGSLLGRGTSSLGLMFSPDGRYLICQELGGELEAFDLETSQKTRMPGSLRDRKPSSIHFVAADQLVVVSREKASDSALLRFPSGEIVGKLGVAGRAKEVSEPGFLVYEPIDGTNVGIFDLQAGRTITKVTDFATDMRGRNIATYRPDGSLVLSNLDNSGQKTGKASAGLVRMLETAAVSPDLNLLVLSTSGEGAVFRTATGKRLGRFDNIHGAICGADADCYVRVTGEQKAFEVQKFNINSGETAGAWSRPGQSVKHDPRLFDGGDDFPSGAVLFSYALDVDLNLGLPGTGPGIPFIAGVSDTVMPYALRALDSQTGRELWRRKFDSPAPVPFSDPQGDRIVLGWNAESAGGRRAAKDNPVANRAIKTDKQRSRDSYFEVLDPRSGKSLGGAVLLDASADHFDSAFSEGDWLVLAKDGQRVFVFSLSSGEQVLKLFGWRPTITAARDMLCLNTADKRVSTYDLKTGKKLHDYTSPAPIFYTHFSADGQKLLILTDEQRVYLLDAGR